MELFEFIMALQSIIIGLAVAEVLSGLAAVIRNRRTRPASWLHTLLALGVLVSLIQLWWENWSLRDVSEWSAPMLLYFLSTPVLTYVLAHIMFPRSDEETGYEAYYFDNVAIIWGMIGITHVLAVTFRPVVFGRALLVPDNLSSFITIGVAVLLACVPRPALHKTALPLIFVAILIDLLAVSYTIS